VGYVRRFPECTRTLDSHASRLRRKLAAVSARPWVVNQWVWGIGSSSLSSPFSHPSRSRHDRDGRPRRLAQVLVSSLVHELVGGSGTEFAFRDAREVELEGLDGGHRLFALS